MENDSYVSLAKNACDLIACIATDLALTMVFYKIGEHSKANERIDSIVNAVSQEGVGILRRYEELEKSPSGDRERAEAYASEVCDE